MLTKIGQYISYAWKAIVALAIPILWAGMIELVEGLQGTFVDNPLIVAALTAIGVYLKGNGPKPL